MEKLGEAELVCVRSVSAGKQSELHLSDISSANLIGLMESDPLGRLLDEKLRQAGLLAAPPIQVQTYYIACALAEEGCGTAIVDTFTANAFRDGPVSISRLKPAITFKVAALYSDLRVLPRHSSAFVKCLKQSVQDMTTE
jgi:DNA-binding transcriptional LysR family regulator